MRCLLLLFSFASLLPLVAASPSAAPSPTECQRDTRGRLFPPAANSSNDARRQAARCGILKMCTGGFLRPHWESLSSPWWRLAGQPAPQECVDLVDSLKQSLQPPALP